MRRSERPELVEFMRRLLAEAPGEDALAWCAFLIQSEDDPVLYWPLSAPEAWARLDLDVLRATYPAAPAKMNLAEGGGGR